MMKNPGFLCNEADPTKCEKFGASQTSWAEEYWEDRLKAERRLDLCLPAC